MRLTNYLMGQFKRHSQQEPQPAQLEIWMGLDLKWKLFGGTLRQFVKKSIRTIKQKHPELVLYRPKRTWRIHDFEREHAGPPYTTLPSMQAYVVQFLPNGVDLMGLKRTCVELELIGGERRADIDIYTPDGHKISRKDERGVTK